MKKILCLLLAALMLFALAACGAPEAADPPTEQPPATPAPAPDPTPEAPPPEPAAPNSFLWDDFTDRDPNNKPDNSPNGAPIWWDNWANLRAGVEDGVVQIDYRPLAFDPEGYDNFDDYYARAADWMGNWGEAIDMWSLEGISFCKYLTIRMSGAEGGEESKLMLHFQPEDGPSFVALFSDLVTREGSNVVITTEMQDIVIDLEASGFPGMTNRMHIRAFAPCVIMLDEISFSEPVAPIDTTDRDTILAGITVPEIGNPADLSASKLGLYLWDNFTDRDPNSKPDNAPNGAPMWWDNWANLRADVVDGIVSLDYRPLEFNKEDFDDEDDYFARAADWMGNWGEAIDMWSLDGIAFSKYFVIRMSGAEGGEESKLMLHFQPEDGPSFVARFSDLITAGGDNVVITTDMQTIVIDLEASGFPGMTNRMHIRAFAPCIVSIDEIFFTTPVAPIDRTDRDTIIGGIWVPEIGNPADLPIKDFIAELS